MEPKKRPAYRSGYTFIELMAVILIVYCAMAGFVVVDKSRGLPLRVAGAVGGGVVGIGIVVLFYRWMWSSNHARLKNLRNTYVGLYRVLALPGDDQPTVLPVGAVIQVGDHGWQAAPLVKKDGLIYLQGLMPDWRTVWHAGFRPDQIERLGLKPSSQYDHWVPYWAKPPADPCPFPIQPRATPSMDRPHHGLRYHLGYPQPQTGEMVKVKKNY